MVNADLASDTASITYQSLLEVWLRLMRETGSTPEQLDRLRVTYGRDVSLLPIERIISMIAAAGFETPVAFLQPFSSMPGMPNELQPSLKKTG